AQPNALGYAQGMSEKVRLGGMALANGVLVHGPTAWAAAVRLPDGRIKVEADRKRFRAADVKNPLLRGPARLVEAFAILPLVRRRLPEARLPFERPGVVAAALASTIAVHAVRESPRLGAAARELLTAAISFAPAAAALRNSSLAAYHGAEHVSIGTYEHGTLRDKEHERCGTHLLGPLLATSAFGNALAAKVPRHLRGGARATAFVGAMAVSTEIFSWMVRNPDHPVSRALAKPGHELQHRLATAEPSDDQLEVAEAALAACLRLEDGSPHPR
ncbi:MAG: DUF1385 domain-containing protein, partial [Actinobacteria bacterium]|nr:DUF1385 domain-containing protein [Actinomycetota bacterium]